MLYVFTLDPPVIDEGSFVPRPSVITKGIKRVKIGATVYVYKGFDVIIDCNIVDGTPPINITWFRNGSPYPTRGNASTITITDAQNSDVFKCRADNIEGFDTKNTTIYVDCGKYTYHTYRTYIRTYISQCIHILHAYVLTYIAFTSTMRLTTILAIRNTQKFN